MSASQKKPYGYYRKHPELGICPPEGEPFAAKPEGKNHRCPHCGKNVRFNKSSGLPVKHNPAPYLELKEYAKFKETAEPYRDPRHDPDTRLPTHLRQPPETL